MGLIFQCEVTGVPCLVRTSMCTMGECNHFDNSIDEGQTKSALLNHTTDISHTFECTRFDPSYRSPPDEFTELPLNIKLPTSYLDR